MTVGVLDDGRRPNVREYDGRVAIWAGDGDDDATGLVFSTSAAVDAAFDMLRLATEITREPIALGSTTIELGKPTEVSEELAARILITTDGAPLAIDIGAAQFVELAAAMGAFARKIG